MSEFSWASGPPDPTRDEVESATEHLLEDTRKRINKAARERVKLKAEISAIPSSTCPVARGQIAAEVKRLRGLLALADAEMQACERIISENS